MLRDKLTEIQRGMRVIDMNGAHVGEVEMVFFSDEDYDEPGPETVTGKGSHPSNVPNWVNEFIESFSLDNELPDPIKQRLHREGFIRVQKDFYLGDKDYCVPLNQITNVVDDTVKLNLAKDNLMKLS